MMSHIHVNIHETLIAIIFVTELTVIINNSRIHRNFNQIRQNNFVILTIELHTIKYY